MGSSSSQVSDRGLLDDPDSVSNILVSAPTHDPIADEVCGELLTAGEPDETGVLWVTFTRSPESCVATWTRRAGAPPDEAAVLVAGGETRSAAESELAAGVTAIEDPGNLTELGVRITEHLEDAAAGTARPVLCFHSLTALLQYADLERTYQFLHTLTSYVAKVGAVAHYHIDPGAHDDQTVATLATLFGKRITVEDGDVTVT